MKFLHPFKFALGDRLVHLKHKTIIGFAEEMSIDVSEVEWVKISRLLDNKLEHEWHRASDLELLPASEKPIGFTS